MIEAVIFDMDGLLIDSEPFWRVSHINALAKHGVTITEDDVRAMAGKRTDEVTNHWRATHDLQHIPNEELEADVVSKVIESINLNGAELPGVKQLISILEEHNIPLAVASSSAPEIIDAVLTKLSLTQHIEIAYSAKYEKFGKPHPGIFLTTAQKLGVAASSCIVFEDSLNGVRAAKAAGMRCVAVPEAVNIDKPEFREADLVVPSLSDVNWEMLQKLGHNN